MIGVFTETSKAKHFFRIKAILMISIILCMAVGTIYVFQTKEHYEMQAKADAIGLAESAITFLPIELVKTLEGKTSDTEIPAYVEIKNCLIEFKKQNEKIKFAYLMTQHDGKIYFMVDSEIPGTDDYSPPGQEYTEASQSDFQPFIDEKSLITEPVIDRWGTWISVLIPIKDNSINEVIAVFGVDYPAEQWNIDVANHIVQSVIIVSCILLLIVGLYLVIVKNIALKTMSVKLKDSEALFKAVFEQAPIGIAVVKGYEFLANMNPMYEKILGRTKEMLKDMNWADITHPEDLQADLFQFTKFKSGEIESYTMVKRFIRPDCSPVWVNMIIAPLHLEKMSQDHLCLIEDITERKCTEEALSESERSKAMLLSNLPGMAYRCNYDREWTMQFLSEGCLALTGYKPESLIGNKEISYNSIILPQFRNNLWSEWEHVLNQRKHFRYEYEITTASGERKWVLELGQGEFDAEGNVVAIEGIVVDITESKQRLIQIQHMNDYDYLTGLYNRRYFEEAKSRIDQDGYLPFSIIIADIDGVRLINDAFGHAVGDKLIIETAKVIKSCCRERDILARVGGDEFSIVMPNTDNKEASRMLWTIKSACEEHNLSISEKTQHINLSIGYGTKQTNTVNIHEVDKEAEEYMFKRKILERKSHHNAILSSVMATMYARSQETEQHAERLATFCRMIGEKLQLSQKNMDDLQLLSMLHDIGKVGIDDRILNKPGKLSGEEWVEMKKHPEIGYRIAMSTPELESIADKILSHHERWDGQGYPQKQRGEEIPLLSRILAVADAYDAMTEDRIYRKAMTKLAALDEIRKNAGTQFDPTIAQIFIESI